MSTYHVWVVALIAGYEGRIIQGMVVKGYNVSAASGNTATLTSKDGPASVIALKVEKNPSITAKEVYDDVAAVMMNFDGKFYSIVVSEFSNQTMWCASNIVLPPIEKIEKNTLDIKVN